MPNYVTQSDGTDETQVEADEAFIDLPDGLDVKRIRVRWGEVSLFDGEGRECVLVSKGQHPGAGMSVQVADHVKAA